MGAASAAGVDLGYLQTEVVGIITRQLPRPPLPWAAITTAMITTPTSSSFLPPCYPPRPFSGYDLLPCCIAAGHCTRPGSGGRFSCCCWRQGSGGKNRGRGYHFLWAIRLRIPFTQKNGVLTVRMDRTSLHCYADWATLQ